jgi:hypothetical protein
MSKGAEKWAAAEKFAEYGSARTAQSMRFYALNRMLDTAESAVLNGREREATESLRELQAHCEKLIAMLAPRWRGRPALGLVETTAYDRF